jgi:hypothetical protein
MGSGRKLSVRQMSEDDSFRLQDVREQGVATVHPLGKDAQTACQVYTELRRFRPGNADAQDGREGNERTVTEPFEDET